MWHFKTKVGVIWIVSDSDKFFLGINNDALGAYPCPEEALSAVNNHMTGHPDWDAWQSIRVPQTLSGWADGEPNGW